MDTKLAKREKDYSALTTLVKDSLSSLNSKVAYEKAISDFLAWHEEQGKPGLNKAVVQRYKNVLIEKGFSPASVNLRLSAIRKLAEEAADNEFISPMVGVGISKVKGVASSGVKLGTWLTKKQAEKLLNMPDVSTLKGLRDRAILAVFVGGGLRRSEVATLEVSHFQQREARWVIVDLKGKGNRVRSVPIEAWTKRAVDEWLEAAHITSGRVFRWIRRGNHVAAESITDEGLQQLVIDYGARCGVKISAHDLRRTYAKLCEKGGAGLHQIQLSLGHASIQTTERYLGSSQDMTDAPADHLGLELDWS